MTTALVNLLWCRPGLVGGSEEYLVRQLLGVATHDGIELRLAAGPDFVAAHPELGAVGEYVVAPIGGARRPLRMLAESLWLPRRQGGVDVVHHGGGTVPVRPPVSRRPRPPVVLTVHDLQYLAYPQYFSALRRRYLAAMLPRSISAAAVVAVPSAFVGGTVLAAFGDRIAPDRVVVVRHGVDAPAANADVAEPADLRRRYDLGDRPFVVFPAITHPHKGHRFLLDVLADQPADLVAVLLGGAGAADESVTAAIAELGLAERVRRPGRVPAADRDGLIAAADALVFPSEYEGFGAPVLEAMALGTPVLCSDRAALPEVVGAAAVVAPLDRDAWRAGLAEVATRRDELGAAGRRRAAEFTTAASGADLAAAYQSAASRSASA